MRRDCVLLERGGLAGRKIIKELNISAKKELFPAFGGEAHPLAAAFILLRFYGHPGKLNPS
jgi:hypothetical protein